MRIETAMNLDGHVAFSESLGARRCDRMLGVHKMPAGYALMLNPDETHFYWLRFDGSESSIDWNKWRVRRSAIANRERREKERAGA